MVGKLILAILVAMTINANMDTSNDIELWGNDEAYYEEDYTDEDYSDNLYEYGASDYLFDLSIEGADWVGMATTPEEIIEALTEITLNEDLEIVYAYYGDTDGHFYVYPEIEMPEDYDFRERPLYQDTMEEEIYYAEPYMDTETGRQVQTIGITVYGSNDGGLIGILGIDAYID